MPARARWASAGRGRRDEGLRRVASALVAVRSTALGAGAGGCWVACANWSPAGAGGGGVGGTVSRGGVIGSADLRCGLPLWRASLALSGFPPDAGRAQSASTRPSRSCSVLQPPTDARSHGRPGMLRTITPRSASARRSRLRVGARERHERRVIARRDLAPSLTQHVRQTSGQLARALLHGGQSGRLQHVERRARAGERLGAHRHRVKTSRVRVGGPRRGRRWDRRGSCSRALSR